MQITTIGLDTAKNLFQVHGADAQAGQTHEISGISTQGAVSDMTVRGRPRAMHQRLAS